MKLFFHVNEYSLQPALASSISKSGGVRSVVWKAIYVNGHGPRCRSNSECLDRYGQPSAQQASFCLAGKSEPRAARHRAVELLASSSKGVDGGSQSAGELECSLIDARHGPLVGSTPCRRFGH